MRGGLLACADGRASKYFSWSTLPRRRGSPVGLGETPSPRAHPPTSPAPSGSETPVKSIRFRLPEKIRTQIISGRHEPRCQPACLSCSAGGAPKYFSWSSLPDGDAGRHTARAHTHTGTTQGWVRHKAKRSDFFVFLCCFCAIEAAATASSASRVTSRVTSSSQEVNAKPSPGHRHTQPRKDSRRLTGAFPALSDMV